MRGLAFLQFAHLTLALATLPLIPFHSVER